MIVLYVVIHTIGTVIVQFNLWTMSFLSLDQFKAHMNMMRGLNAVTKVGGQG
jgi:hypothetical protein